MLEFSGVRALDVERTQGICCEQTAQSCSPDSKYFLHRPNNQFYFAYDEGAIAEINNRREKYRMFRHD